MRWTILLKPVDIEELVNAVQRLQTAERKSVDKELKNPGPESSLIPLS